MAGQWPVYHRSVVAFQLVKMGLAGPLTDLPRCLITDLVQNYKEGKKYGTEQYKIYYNVVAP